MSPEQIYKLVCQYRKKLKTNNPFDLLDAIGAVVKFSGAYPAGGLRGYCTVLLKTKYCVISQNQPEEEQRVVAAHEAGHLILHQERLKAGALQDWDVYHAEGVMEREANLFAADFLIDDVDILEQVQAKNSDFFSLAKALSVPAPFLAFKLYSMVHRGHRLLMPSEPQNRFLKK